jgi:hypothetical protein
LDWTRHNRIKRLGSGTIASSEADSGLEAAEKEKSWC